jgi:hypothetical protein
LRSDKEINVRFGKPLDGFDLTYNPVENSQVNQSQQTPPRPYGLPMAADASAKVRIRRRNIFGENVFQLHEANALCAGFASDGQGGVDWEKPSLLPGLNQKNLVVVDAYDNSLFYVPLSEWRKVYDQNNVKVWQAIGGKIHPYIKIEAPWIIFKQWVNSVKPPLTTALELGDVLKVVKFDNSDKDLSDLMGQPKSVLYIEQVGDVVKFRYIANTRNKAMKEKFNNPCS